MKKVLMDVTSLLSRNLSTNGLYTKNLFRLLKGIGVEVEAVYKAPRGFKDNFIESHIKQTPKKFISFFASKGVILHGPSGHLLSESDKFIKVLSINDLTMYREGMMPDHLATQLQTHLKQQLQGSIAAVFVPTYELHNELLARFPKMVNKVHVVSPGSDHLLDASGSMHTRLIENPYFLFVGTLDKKSNLLGVLKGFNALAQIQPKLQLVITGERGYGADAIQKTIDTSSIRERIRLMGAKSDAHLKRLYSDAIATVIPSYSEGFSFPLVEAMKMGCPVITSPIGTMKEVGGEAVHMVNPKDPEQIMGAMERLYVDRVYRDKLIAAGKETTQKMSWLRCARAVSDIYQGL
jgi:glycosyltransferase involved in cell wall biosynthesis